VKDAWQKDHIHNTSSNNTDLAGVDSRLMDAVVRTSMEYGLDLGINAGKEDCCDHSADGAHKDGLAVDINTFGSTRFNQMTPDQAQTAGNWLGAQISNRLPQGTAHIVANPAWAFDRQHPVTDRDRLQRLLRQHTTHVHVTIAAP
jgi:hypothetical protein